MKTSWLRLVVVAGLSIGALAVSTAGAAASSVDPSIFRGSGQMAQVSFDIPDSANPCLDTSGFVFGGNFKNSSPGTPAPPEMVGGIVVVRNDVCAGTFISGVFYKGPLPAGAFQIDKTLTSASLVATVVAMDDNRNPVPVSVNIVWVGTGVLTSSDFSKHIQSPGLNIVIHASGDSRDAQAAGAVVVGGSSLAVQAPGSLQSDRSFELFVCHSPLTGCK
jgi:hypothetical protein